MIPWVRYGIETTFLYFARPRLIVWFCDTNHHHVLMIRLPHQNILQHHSTPFYPIATYSSSPSTIVRTNPPTTNHAHPQRPLRHLHQPPPPSPLPHLSITLSPPHPRHITSSALHARPSQRSLLLNRVPQLRQSKPHASGQRAREGGSEV